MQTLIARLAVLAGLGVIASAGLSVASPAPFGIVTATVVLAVAVACLALAVVVATPGMLTVGSRARDHRESLSEIAAPSHPRTPGRVRSRAPGMRVPA